MLPEWERKLDDCLLRLDEAKIPDAVDWLTARMAQMLDDHQWKVLQVESEYYAKRMKAYRFLKSGGKV